MQFPWPLSGVDAGFPSRHLLRVPRVDQEDFKASCLQNLEQWHRLADRLESVGITTIAMAFGTAMRFFVAANEHAASDRQDDLPRIAACHL
jgi:hypothetical protein